MKRGKASSLLHVLKWRNPRRDTIVVILVVATIILLIQKELMRQQATTAVHADSNWAEVVSWRHQHTGRQLTSSDLYEEDRRIAIGCAVTTRRIFGLDENNIKERLPLFKQMLPTFCKTASIGFNYTFFIAHDNNDPFFNMMDAHLVFQQAFASVLTAYCSYKIAVSLHIIEVPYGSKPSWAQADAMLVAYLEDMPYFYRINDDTRFTTSGWTEAFISRLANFQPPNVGVVGPQHKGGNEEILTYDFVHRTHMDIYGVYYPRIFTTWWADQWISDVYSPSRFAKLPSVQVEHVQGFKSRYDVDFSREQYFREEESKGKAYLARWLEAKQKASLSRNTDTRHVIAYTLYGANLTYTYGAIRIAQLAPVIFPKWKLRFYVEDSSGGENSTKYPAVPSLILKILRRLGAQISIVSRDDARDIPAAFWKFLVADDPNISKFLLRDVTTRPTDREAIFLEHWMTSKEPFYCIRDHPNHGRFALMGNLFGGKAVDLQKTLRNSIRESISGYKDLNAFLNERVWPLIKSNTLCHDSVACEKYPNSAPAPLERTHYDYIGEHVAPYGEPLYPDELVKLQRMAVQKKCVNDTRYSMLFYSLGMSIAPVYDVKNTLRPFGVKFVDNSLSENCGAFKSCASSLKVLNRNNTVDLSAEDAERFFQAYKEDYLFTQVDAFVCTDPVSVCEAFVKFNKSLLIMTSTRYEKGRTSPIRWRQWNKRLLTLANDPTNVIAATSKYDVEYMKYFLGTEALLLEPSCAYLKYKYNPKKNQFLLGPILSDEFRSFFRQELNFAMNKTKVNVEIEYMPYSSLFKAGSHRRISEYKGIIHIPFDVTSMYQTEQYRMNIPLFFPSLDLLIKWHLKYQLLQQRTLAGQEGRSAKASAIPGVMDVPDPNDDTYDVALRHWLQYADYYQWPYVILFESLDDLVEKLERVDLAETSREMMTYNTYLKEQLLDKWKRVLTRLAITKTGHFWRHSKFELHTLKI
ncbi:uncharacterized protein LOC106171609 isoform X2 [Lingula anatina]|nr:uncharacterized protein LOC106171609 isoform X2 [Lingula anatina]|eukprot:XP_013407498.1 uncharacterized protein LOC106171609 isoform X2 [Lingula anatina]